MSVVRAWNQSERRHEFGVFIAPATQDKYLYVRTTTGQTKRFRRDRCVFLEPSQSPSSQPHPLRREGALPGPHRDGDACGPGGVSNVP